MIACVKDCICPPYRGRLVTILSQVGLAEKKQMLTPSAWYRTAYWVVDKNGYKTWHFAENLEFIEATPQEI